MLVTQEGVSFDTGDTGVGSVECIMHDSFIPWTCTRIYIFE